MIEHTAQPGSASSGPSRGLKPSVLARSPEKVLIAVTVVSLLLHAALWCWVYDKPVGYVDPATLQQRQQVLRIKRASYDMVIDPLAQQGQSEADDAPNAESLSQALLEETVSVPQSPPIEVEADLQPIDEPTPETDASQLAMQDDALDLTGDLLSDLGGSSPEELGYYGVDDTAPGSSPAGSGTGQSEAQRLLAGAGFGGMGNGTGAGGAGAGGAAAALPREAAVVDRNLLELPTAATELDLAELALEDTTQIDVPEHLDEDFDYAVTRYPGKGDEAGYFRVDITARSSLKKLRTMPKDVVFVVDTSSSVPQPWVRQSIRGVQQSLSTLNAEDRFNIVMFSDQPALFSADGPQPATPDNVNRASQFLWKAESAGWTDVNAALSRLLVRDIATERVYDIVLISDGKPTRGVLDTRELINLITRDNDLTASIYCVGIGRDPNRELLDFLAYRNKGFCVFVDDVADLAEGVRALMSRLRYPLIKNVQLSVLGKAVDEVYPIDLPNIHQGERFSIFGRYDATDEFTMRVIGSNAGRQVDFTFTRNLADAPQGQRQIAYDWAFWKLHHLYSEMIRQGDSQQVRDAIEQLRRQYRLKTLY